MIICDMFLQAKHAVDGNTTWGVNGETGEITDMNELGVWDTYSVKAQTLKTAIEVGFFFHVRTFSLNHTTLLSFLHGWKTSISKVPEEFLTLVISISHCSTIPNVVWLSFVAKQHCCHQIPLAQLNRPKNSLSLQLDKYSC